MNWKRGLVRAWIVFAALFAIGVIGTYYGDLAREFQFSRSWTAETVSLVPVKCAQARGRNGYDYQNEEYYKELLIRGVSQGLTGLCWYEMPRFRQVFPEYSDLSDHDLMVKLFTAAEIYAPELITTAARRPSPWLLTTTLVGLAAGVSILTLVLGTVFAWIVDGFSMPKSIPADREPPL